MLIKGLVTAFRREEPTGHISSKQMHSTAVRTTHMGQMGAVADRLHAAKSLPCHMNVMPDPEAVSGSTKTAKQQGMHCHKGMHSPCELDAAADGPSVWMIWWSGTPGLY